MKYYALSTDRPCKHCKKFHKYVTNKHRIIIATETSKFLLDEFSKKHPSSKVVEIDLAFLIRSEIPHVSIVFLLQEKKPEIIGK